MDNEQDIIQKLSADFNVINDLSIDFNVADKPMKVLLNEDAPFNAEVNSSDPSIDTEFKSSLVPIDIQLGSVYVVSGDSHVLYALTSTWNSQPQLISERGYIYIYADYRQNQQGQNIPSIKVGDGSSYLIDMPFSDSLIYEHINDRIKHITQEERDKWNNKVRCYISDNDILVFTTD